MNFALYSRNATEVLLALFDSPDGPPSEIIRLEGPDRHVFHAFVQGVGAGQLYGYRVRGPFRPGEGLRFNENKLLLDPYAKAVAGKFRDHDGLLLSYDPSSPEKDLSLDVRDDSRSVPRAVVVDDRFDWQGDRPSGRPLEKLVIYEVHLKGFTAHPSSGVRRPGTYLGFIEKIPYLKGLGVNAVELLPIHEFYVEDFLLRKGLTNYWGYNTVGFFAPESSYAASGRPGSVVAEFKTLVRELHKAGIDVFLDVVYNHTAEGNELGPTLSLKGIDNPTYYALTGPPDAPGRHYLNWTGCGNSLNVSQPAVIRLIMDSLRYWVREMHVDGFRFDLASVLGRGSGRYESSSSFFHAISQDPVLRGVHLIAEPWDLGTYEVGNFPVDWSEWNGRFRDTVRRFWRGDPGQAKDLGWRLTGSADLYGDDGRSPRNSVNLVTCHDGFTLNDLLSFNGKRNGENGEENRDGTEDNHSWNCGQEGETQDPGVLRLRRRLAKDHALTLLFSCGTPMLLGGDEFLRTQKGNNNAYCQDNEISWFDWAHGERNREMTEFVRKAIDFTKTHPVLQRRKFLLGKDLDADQTPDITWFGKEGGPPRWEDPMCRTLAYRLDGGEGDPSGRKYFLLVILNADPDLQEVRLPPLPGAFRWARVADTSLEPPEDFASPGEEVPLRPEDRYLVNPRSMVVLLSR